MNVLDLFSGIGGFSLGLERAGMRTVAFCEIEPFCRAVLKKHWPHVPCYEDVRELTADRLAADGIAVDVVCGGFPCQDISVAGKGAGLTGERSGLWSEYARIIGELRPRYVIVENVAALLGRGLDRVLRDLAALGFDAEWHCIPAAAIGAPHRRDRLWIVAYPKIDQQKQPQGDCGWPSEASIAIGSITGTGGGMFDGNIAERVKYDRRITEALAGILSNADRPRFSLARSQQNGTDGEFGGRMPSSDSWWAIEPNVGRVAHGVPARVDRLKGLGNAVVPQIPEIIGRAIMNSLSGDQQ